MSEYLNKILVETPDKSAKEFRVGGCEPIVEYLGGSGQDLSEMIKEVYIIGPVSPYYEDMTIEIITMSVVSVKRSDGKGSTSSSYNGIFTFNIDGTYLYMYIDTSKFIDYIIGGIRIIDANRHSSISASPIIYSYLNTRNKISELSDKIFAKWSTVDVIDRCIVELYSATLSSKSFKFDRDGKWYYNNNDWVEIKNGFNKFVDPVTQVATYIIWRNIDATNVASWNTSFLSAATDISNSPAIASYIALEKLIEDKLSSITNQ